MNRILPLLFVLLLSVSCTGSMPAAPALAPSKNQSPASTSPPLVRSEPTTPAATFAPLLTSVPPSAAVLFLTPIPLPTSIPLSTLSPAPVTPPLPAWRPVAIPDVKSPLPSGTEPNSSGAIGESIGSSIVSDEVALLIDEGLEFLDQDRKNEAIAKFEEAERIHGNPLNEAQSGIGLAYAQLGDFHLAIDHFTWAIAAGDFASTRVNRAIAYYSVNMCPEAVLDSVAALEMEPVVSEMSHTDVDAHLSLATCFTRGRDFTLALEHTDMAYHLALDHGVLGEGAYTASSMHDRVEKIARGDAYVEDLLSPIALAYFFDGLVHRASGDDQEAILAFESAQESNWAPSSGIFHETGFVFFQMEDYESALRYFSLGLGVRDDGAGRSRRAHAYYLMGDCDTALRDAYAALKLPPDDFLGYHSYAEALLVRAKCLAEYGHLDVAAADFEEALRLARRSSYSFADLASMEEVAGYLLQGVDFDPMVGSGVFDCDTSLRQQLVFQRGATNAERINYVIRYIQDHNGDTCSANVWNPKVDDGNFVNALASDRFGAAAAVRVPSPAELAGEGCWLADVWAVDASGTVSRISYDATGADARVGSTVVPAGLRIDNTLTGTVRRFSGRDTENNIIVYWASELENRPADGARCWLYVRGDRSWDETY